MDTISSWVDKYLEYLKSEKNASPLTIRNYSHYLKRFLEFVRVHYPTLDSPEKIDERVINNYYDYLKNFIDEKNTRLDTRTQGFHLISLRSFIRYLISKGLRMINLELIAVPRFVSKELKFLDQNQTISLLRLAKNARDRSIMEILLSTGVRVSDLVKLNKNDINYLNREVSIKGKKGEIRKIFVADSCLYWLKKYLQERRDNIDALFIRTAGKKDSDMRLTVRSIQRIIEKYVKKGGLNVKATPHSLRHTFAVNLLSKGTRLSALKQLLGHKNISTTQIYTHVTNPQLRQIHQKFHRK